MRSRSLLFPEYKTPTPCGASPTLQRLPWSKGRRRRKERRKGRMKAGYVVPIIDWEERRKSRGKGMHEE